VFILGNEENLAAYKPYVKGRHFRLIGLADGKPWPIEKNKKAKLEAAISKTLSLQPKAKTYVTTQPHPSCIPYITALA
jgi:hypothetical protein